MSSTALAETQPKAKEPLVGRVAQVLNARELVINIGSDAGVKPGARFAVLAEAPLEVKDPQTGQVLDTVDREKTRVEASEVRERITVCRTYRMIGTPPLFDLSPLASVSLAVRGNQRPETLHVEDSSLPPPLPERQSYVKINDRVIQVAD